MNPSIHSPCPVCGAPIPEGAPQGLCPRCLITAAAAAEPRTALPPPDPALLALAFPQLEVLELLGSGGMGSVYKARQLPLDRIIALKILSPDLARDPSFAERFLREARALARLNHPNIVHVYDFGEAKPAAEAPPFWFLVMEYVDGVNLRQAMRAGGVSPAEALVIVPKLCEALHYAHDSGVMHRDIKPENILLDAQGRVKLVDFGLALMAGDGVPGATLTMSGTRLGTPHYMAPEQVEKPHDVDHRADIYSLGVVFYELLTGELPLGRFSAPSERAGTDPSLDNVVFRTLEKERDRRYQTAGDMGTAVENVSHAAPPAIPPLPVTDAAAPLSPAARIVPPVRVERQRTSRRAIWGLVLQLLAVPLVLLAFLGLFYVRTGVTEETAVRQNLESRTITLEQGIRSTAEGSNERVKLEAELASVRKANGMNALAPARAMGTGILFLFIPFLLVGLCSLLSWMAVFDIRRADGALGGAGLAATGAMLLPTVLLASVVCLLFSQGLGSRFSTSEGQFTVALIGFALGLAGAIAALLRLRKFADRIPPVPVDPADANARLWGIVSACLCAIGLGVLLFRLPVNPPNREATQRLISLFLMLNLGGLACGWLGWKNMLGRIGVIVSCVLFLGSTFLVLT